MEKEEEAERRRVEEERLARLPKRPQQPIIVVEDLKRPKAPKPQTARQSNDLNSKMAAASFASTSSAGFDQSSAMTFGEAMTSESDKSKKPQIYSPGLNWPADLPLPEQTGKDLNAD